MYFFHREKPVFITGEHFSYCRDPVFITGISLLEKVHRENPVFITGMGLQCIEFGVCQNYGLSEGVMLIGSDFVSMLGSGSA